MLHLLQSLENHLCPVVEYLPGSFANQAQWQVFGPVEILDQRLIIVNPAVSILDRLGSVEETWVMLQQTNPFVATLVKTHVAI